jgi:hypothetical protein
VGSFFEQNNNKIMERQKGSGKKTITYETTDKKEKQTICIKETLLKAK